jgi:vacuolar-type H+-ATPase subunit E/Vma4
MLKSVGSSKQQEISEVDSRLRQEYENRLQDNVDELREQYEELLTRSREDADRVYQEKVR